MSSITNIRNVGLYIHELVYRITFSDHIISNCSETAFNDTYAMQFERKKSSMMKYDHLLTISLVKR